MFCGWVDTFQGFDFVFYENSKKFSVSQIDLLSDKKLTKSSTLLRCFPDVLFY